MSNKDKTSNGVKKIINRLHKSKFFGAIFHTLDHCLQKELKDCESVLDLGCGPSSPLQYCKNIKHSVGVEAFEPYLREAQKNRTHTEFLAKKIEELDFPERSFDAIILIEVLEHLPEQAGLEIIKKAEKWAKKKVIISTPNGYFPMGEVDGNIFQKHLSGWSVSKLEQLGFKCHGVSGAKFLYLKENAVHSLINQEDNIFSNMRFRPKKLFYLINSGLQIITHFFPKNGLWLVCRKKEKCINCFIFAVKFILGCSRAGSRILARVLSSSLF